MAAAISGLPRALFPTLSPRRRAAGGSTAQGRAGSVPAAAWWGPGRMQGLRQSCSICFSSGCWGCWAVMDALFISFSPAQDVSVRLGKRILGSAAPSILPGLLLAPGSRLSRPGGLKLSRPKGGDPRSFCPTALGKVPALGKGWAGLCQPGDASGQGLGSGSRGAGQLQALLGTGTRVGGTAGALTHSSHPQGGEGAGRGCAVWHPHRPAHPPSPSPSCPAPGEIHLGFRGSPSTYPSPVCPCRAGARLSYPALACRATTLGTPTGG